MGKLGFVFLLLVIGSALVAQGEASKVLTLEQVLTLHQAGLGETELLAAISRHGVLPLDATDRKRVTESGLPEACARLLLKSTPKGSDLTLEDVLSLVAASVPEESILRAIKDSGRAFAIDVPTAVDLARRGVTPTIIKALRTPPAPTGPTEAGRTPTPAPTLDDLKEMARAGWSKERMLTRITQSNPHFSVTVDDLIDLARSGVPESVTKEVWARREVTETEDAGSLKSAATASDAAQPNAYQVHEEPGGDFTLLVPTGWAVHRENRGQNTLVSFTDVPLEDTTSVANAELQVFRFRAKDRSRLTPENLKPIAENFLARLMATYRAKGDALTYEPRGTVPVSGSLAERFVVTSASANGVNQRGEVCVTYVEDVVYVLAFATRLDDATSPSRLERCLRSFAAGRTSWDSLPSNLDERVPVLFDRWQKAVVGRDYASLLNLGLATKDPVQSRLRFLELADRLGRPEVRVQLSGTARSADEARVSVAVQTVGGPEEALTLLFTNRDGRLLLQDF